jgi:hypothetical protein
MSWPASPPPSDRLLWERVFNGSSRAAPAAPNYSASEPQPIDRFAAEESPLELVIAIDISDSMTGAIGRAFFPRQIDEVAGVFRSVLEEMSNQ